MVEAWSRQGRGRVGARARKGRGSKPTPTLSLKGGEVKGEKEIWTGFETDFGWILGCLGEFLWFFACRNEKDVVSLQRN